MCCEGCERRVKNTVSGMKGVKSVQVNRKDSRVTVNGHIEPKKVLAAVTSTGKKAEFWPYVPYSLVHYPYAPQAYDKKAPPGYVKNVHQELPTPNAPEEDYTWLFSDDNPNACSIM
ncbi:Heavy metal-associated isoprenylated plant protein 21 [Dionaea muscipula]